MAIDVLIKNSWAGFQKTKTCPFVVPNTIPILWFGDYNAYNTSELRIVTIGLNPSDREFIDKVGSAPSVLLRFPKAASLVGKKTLSLSDICIYRSAMNSYFTNVNAFGGNTYYKPWFSSNEVALSGFDASYMPGKINTAIHIDLETPIATIKWSKLSKGQRLVLKCGLGYSFNDLLKELNPTVIIACMNQSLIQSNFCSHKGSPCTPFNTDYSFSRTTGNGHVYAFIRSYTLHGGKYLIWGNNGNIPFARIKHSDIKTHIHAIKTLYGL